MAAGIGISIEAYGGLAFKIERRGLKCFRALSRRLPEIMALRHV